MSALTAVTGFSVHQLDVSLLLGGVVLLVAVLAVRLSERSGLPTLLLYLGLGLLIGESGPFHLRFDDQGLTQVLGYVALVVILAEGGITTSWSSIRPAVGPAAALATVGVLVSVGVVGAAAHLILDVSWPVALLVGAVLTPTDAAAVFSVLRRVNLPRRAERHPGGRVRLQRRPRGDPGRGAVRAGGRHRLARLVGARRCSRRSS